MGIWDFDQPLNSRNRKIRNPNSEIRNCLVHFLNHFRTWLTNIYELNLMNGHVLAVVRAWKRAIDPSANKPLIACA
jgi:hypothetical protein